MLSHAEVTISKQDYKKKTSLLYQMVWRIVFFLVDTFQKIKGKHEMGEPRDFASARCFPFYL